MGDRRKARELVLQALFSFDMNKSDSEKFDSDQSLDEFCANNEEKLTQGIKPFFLDLVKGVIENRSQIDALLNQYSKNWKITRINHSGLLCRFTS